MFSFTAGSKWMTAYLPRTPGMLPLADEAATDLPAIEWTDGFSLVFDLTDGTCDLCDLIDWASA